MGTTALSCWGTQTTLRKDALTELLLLLALCGKATPLAPSAPVGVTWSPHRLTRERGGIVMAIAACRLAAPCKSVASRHQAQHITYPAEVMQRVLPMLMRRE